MFNEKVLCGFYVGFYVTLLWALPSTFLIQIMVVGSNWKKNVLELFQCMVIENFVSRFKIISEMQRLCEVKFEFAFV